MSQTISKGLHGPRSFIGIIANAFSPISRTVHMRTNKFPYLGGTAKTYYPPCLQPLWGTSLSLTLSPYPLKALLMAPLVRNDGLEPPTSWV